jgi:hypothetical protein
MYVNAYPSSGPTLHRTILSCYLPIYLYQRVITNSPQNTTHEVIAMYSKYEYEILVDNLLAYTLFEHSSYHSNANPQHMDPTKDMSSSAPEDR